MAETELFFSTHHADLCRNQVAKSVEPPHVGFQVGGFFLLVTEARLLNKMRARTHIHTYTPQVSATIGNSTIN